MSVLLERIDTEELNGQAVFCVPCLCAPPVYRLVKRVFDVVISALLLVALSPLILIVALCVRLTSPGPIIFKQLRAGVGGKPFTMFKFRTMRDGAENDRDALAVLNEQDGPVFKIAADPRLTRIGRFLRRSSIDELPQLINCLLGQMSLVGPRPLWIDEACQAKGQEKFRMSVKPGLTCLWQVSGRSELSYDKWVALDLYYVHHRSLLLDAMILVQTIPAVLSARGAY